jgi:hypothetical protein
MTQESKEECLRETEENCKAKTAAKMQQHCEKTSAHRETLANLNQAYWETTGPSVAAAQVIADEVDDLL